MQASSTIYSLFGLVVGLGIAEILKGFAEAWRIRHGVGRVPSGLRIGWLLPLLGTLVIMDQTQFYVIAYAMRDAVPFTYFSLLSVLGVVGTYYMCSTFVFPDDPTDWPDYDHYYLRVRRIVAGGMLAAKVALIGFGTVLVLNGHELAPLRHSTGFDETLSLLFLPLLAGLLVARSKTANLALLLLLNLNLILGAVAPLIEAAS